MTLNVWGEVVSHKYRGLWSRTPQPFPVCLPTMVPWAILLHNSPAAEEHLAVFHSKKTYIWVRAFILKGEKKS